VKEVGAACADDITSWCADVKPGQGAVVRCLAQNKASLTPACQDVVQGAQEKVAEFKKACGKDAKKLCKGIAPARGGSSHASSRGRRSCRRRVSRS
jgi:hypothetical protein